MFSTNSSKALEKLLDHCSSQQKIISRNIANIGTANYQRQEVRFDDMLSESLTGALKITNDRHFQVSRKGITPEDAVLIKTDNSQEMYSGVNNVDIDREMSDMAQNTILFRFAARKLNGFFRTIQDVIKSRG